MVTGGGGLRNSEEAAAFLDAASPTFAGGFLLMAHDRLYPFWVDLDEALRTGEPQNEVKRTGKRCSTSSTPIPHGSSSSSQR
jgi:hypothetical protein